MSSSSACFALSTLSQTFFSLSSGVSPTCRSSIDRFRSETLSLVILRTPSKQFCALRMSPFQEFPSVMSSSSACFALSTLSQTFFSLSSGVSPTCRSSIDRFRSETLSLVILRTPSKQFCALRMSPFFQ
uniref:Putative secreted protein n=1 Tax=Ixodes ricinus TaxID=34613 RepID=A0A6B0UQK7_IXORI